MSIVKLNNRGVRNVSAFGSVGPGSMVFIKKLTASSSGNLTFLNGSSDVVFDSTYKEYLFTFKDIHLQTGGQFLTFQGTTDGSNYNTTITSTNFGAYHNEGGTDAGVAYDGSYDQAQGTAFQNLHANGSQVNDNDASIAGTLRIFNPASTTFVKNFMSTIHFYGGSNYATSTFCAGYFNTTSAVTGIQWKISSGNIDAGDICLYGIK